jgi:hypothetical protein
VVVEEHRDDDPHEATDRRHFVILPSPPVGFRPRPRLISDRDDVRRRPLRSVPDR